jgi:hypothetical protein
MKVCIKTGCVRQTCHTFILICAEWWGLMANGVLLFGPEGWAILDDDIIGRGDALADRTSLCTFWGSWESYLWKSIARSLWDTLEGRSYVLLAVSAAARIKRCHCWIIELNGTKNDVVCVINDLLPEYKSTNPCFIVQQAWLMRS